MKRVFVVGCCRTAIGSFGGALRDVPAVALGMLTIQEALARANVASDWVDELYFGCVLTAGLGQNVARQVALGAGLPVQVPASTVNMVCGSGMKSVLLAAQAIRSGDAEIAVAGGTENMSAAAYAASQPRWGARLGEFAMKDTMISDGLWDAFGDCHMGETAENVCDRWGIDREEMDAFALRSQQRAAAAIASGRFRDEIVPVPVASKKETLLFATDEYPRPSTAPEALAALRPAFRKKDGRVTAGNSSGINDGAAALVVASEDAVRAHGLIPMAEIKGWGQAGVEPSVMGVGPVDAVWRALARAGLSLEAIDLIEANEAFAAQSIAVARELGFDMGKVNVNGGAIALGHPIGASGARIIVSLLHEMAKRSDARYGLATLCVGGGMGIASVFEKAVK